MPNIIAGRKPVMEALRAGTPVEQVVFLLGVQGRIIQEIRQLAEQKHVQVVQASKQQFRELATDATTQGVVAVVPDRSYRSLNDVLAIPARHNAAGFLLLLDEIEDPHNLGALVRTAECAGVHGVIIPKHHAAAVTSAVIRASAGATEYMPIAEVTNIVHSIEELKKHGYWIVGLDSGGDRLYTDPDYNDPVAIVVGNEGRGMRRLVKEHCDHLVRIPLHGRVESLNASVAGALALFEVVRCRMAKESRESRGL
jgi:23S rRNA (guanosine2251-2'-O)-methyltransferase